jgi:hypothetical protein
MIEIKVKRELRTQFGDRNTNVVWQWCVDMFGPPEPNGKRWAWDTFNTFWFYNQADAVLFSLRWA